MWTDYLTQPGRKDKHSNCCKQPLLYPFQLQCSPSPALKIFSILQRSAKILFSSWLLPWALQVKPSLLPLGLPYHDLHLSAHVVFKPCVTGSVLSSAVLSSWRPWLQLPQPQNPIEGGLIHKRGWTSICSTSHRVPGAASCPLNLDLLFYLQENKKVFCSQDENQSSSNVLLGTWKVLILEYPWLQKREDKKKEVGRQGAGWLNTGGSSTGVRVDLSEPLCHLL